MPLTKETNQNGINYPRFTGVNKKVDFCSSGIWSVAPIPTKWFPFEGTPPPFVKTTLLCMCMSDSKLYINDALISAESVEIWCWYARDMESYNAGSANIAASEDEVLGGQVWACHSQFNIPLQNRSVCLWNGEDCRVFVVERVIKWRRFHVLGSVIGHHSWLSPRLGWFLG